MKLVTILDMSIFKSILNKKKFDFKGHTFDADENGNPIVDGKIYTDGNWERAFTDFQNLVFPPEEV